MNLILHLIAAVCQTGSSAPSSWWALLFFQGTVFLMSIQNSSKHLHFSLCRVLRLNWGNQVCLHPLYLLFFGTNYTIPSVLMLYFRYSKQWMLASSVNHCISVSLFHSSFFHLCFIIFSKCYLLHTVISILLDPSHGI